MILGVSESDIPPKSWNIGGRAAFAWHVSFMPQILVCAEALASHECLMVVEDSCWPSSSLTPTRVYDELQRRDKALWLAAKLKPKVYTHRVGDAVVSALAAAGSKCVCGRAAFWRNVTTLFHSIDKNWSADAVFQSMVGLGELDLVHPFLGACMPHVSQRTRQVEISHGLAPSDIEGTLLPLPEGWEEQVGSM